MAFDKSLDRNLFSETIDLETTRITVGIFAYNDGEPKMQLSRENRNMNSGEWAFSKLGRLFYDEAEQIIPLMQKALAEMPKPKDEPLEGEESSEEEKKDE